MIMKTNGIDLLSLALILRQGGGGSGSGTDAIARQMAQLAKTKADQAMGAANDAQTTADNAVTSAGVAQDTANQAVLAAESAQTTADNAVTAAGVAQTTAEGAQTVATGAATAASNAQTTANNAATAASNAQSTADGAVSDVADLAEVVDGKSDKATVIQTSDSAISLTLADNTILQCGTVTSVNVTLGNGSYTNGYVVDISFTSGATATNWNVLTPLFTGTDCEDNVFVPQPSKRYNVTMFWDGAYIVGLVVGNEITIS